MKILFSGGGTLGSVTPLIAIKEIVTEAYPHAQFVWIGTNSGPEKIVISQKQFIFYGIASGKMRRYISILNLFDLLKITYGFFQSLRILLREKPDLCVSAGGFVSVPVHIAAWVLRIPTWIHQQDILPGLANIFMAPSAKQVTVATEISKKYFSPEKTVWLGNPVRKDIFLGNKIKAIKQFDLSEKKPIVFITGGGTGSARINALVVEALPHLSQSVEIIHLFGQEREQKAIREAEKQYAFYHPYSFFNEEMKDAYAVADLVVSRGGFGAIAELAALEKTVIFIPKPGHQEDNLFYIKKEGAAIVLDEQKTDGKELALIVKQIMADKNISTRTAKKFHDLFPIAKKNEVLRLISDMVG